MTWRLWVCLGAVFIGSGSLLAGGSAESREEDAVRQAALAALSRAIKAKDDFALFPALNQTRRVKGEAAAISPLLGVLREETDSRRRELARLALNRIGSRAGSAAPGLRAQLKGGEIEDRAWAAVALSWIEPSQVAELVSPLTEGLRDGQARTRQETAYALGMIGAEWAVADLGMALGDAAVAVRQNAALALGMLGPAAKGSVTALRRAIRDKEPVVAVPAAAALLGADPSELPHAVPILLAGLKQPDESVRRQALAGLAQAPPDASEAKEIPAALGRILQAPEARVREAALLALPSFGTKAVGQLAAIQALLDDPSRECRMAAAAALSYLSLRKAAHGIPVLRDGLRHADEIRRGESAGALGRIGSPAGTALADLLLALKDEEGSVRMEAALALGKIGEKRATPGLLEALKDESAALRALAAASLSVLAPDQAKQGLAALRRGLAKENPRIRQETALALGRLGAEAREAVPDLLKGLDDADPGTRAAAAAALTSVELSKAPCTTRQLQQGLKHENLDIRRESMEGLARLGPAANDALADLLPFLEGEDWSLRGTAAWALNQIEPKKAGQQAVAALIALLRHSDPNARVEAALGLGRLGPAAKEAVRPLSEAAKDKDREVSRAALNALGRVGGAAKPAVPVLVAVMGGNDTDLAVLAAHSLGLIDLRDLLASKAVAIPALQKGLTQKDPIIQLFAATVLAFFGTEARATAPALLKALHDGNPDVRAMAAIALTAVDLKQAKEQAIPVLIEALKHPLPQYRVLAANALRQMGPDARKAIPALTKALDDKDRRVHTAAAAALAAIGS